MDGNYPNVPSVLWLTSPYYGQLSCFLSFHIILHVLSYEVSPSPNIKEGASTQMLLLLERRAPRNLCWAQFGIQNRGLPKWEVLQVICFSDWEVSGGGVKTIVLGAWSRLSSWCYSSGWTLEQFGQIWHTLWRNLETAFWPQNIRKICRTGSFWGCWSLVAHTQDSSLEISKYLSTCGPLQDKSFGHLSLFAAKQTGDRGTSCVYFKPPLADAEALRMHKLCQWCVCTDKLSTPWCNCACQHLRGRQDLWQGGFADRDSGVLWICGQD